MVTTFMLRLFVPHEFDMLSSEELLEDPTMPSTLSLSLSLSDSGFESEASGMFSVFPAQLKSKSYCAFSCFSAHIFNIEIYSYSNILRLQAKCRKMF